MVATIAATSCSQESSPLLPLNNNGLPVFRGNNSYDEDEDDEEQYECQYGSTVASERLSQFASSMSRISTKVWQHVGQIGVLGSMSIAVNFLTGPAMLEIPAVFQKSGIVPTTITIVVVAALSCLGSLHMARAISQVPGNATFQKDVEYSEAFRRLFLLPPVPANDNDSMVADPKQLQRQQQLSHYWFVGTQVVFFACVTCLNVSSMVDSAQVFDTILANVLGGTRALQLTREYWHWIPWTYASCTQEILLRGECIPFEQAGDGDDDGVLLTAGYVLIVFCFLPLSLMNLQENAAWQVVEFLVLLITSVMFSCLFWQNGLEWQDDRISWWGESWDGLLGVILFNFALVISVASWLYEKEPTVNAKQVIVGATILSALLYMVLGILGAMSMPHVSENMLETFMSGAMGTAMQWTSSIFALFIVGLGIPLLCVLCRLNLTGSGMSHSNANILSVYVPFGLSWLLYRGDLVTQLLSWGGIIFTSLIAFIFPLLLALQALNVVRDDPGTILVYGRWWAERSTKQRERRALYILLAVSLLAIVAAIVGNIMGNNVFQPVK